MLFEPVSSSRAPAIPRTSRGRSPMKGDYAHARAASREPEPLVTPAPPVIPRFGVPDCTDHRGRLLSRSAEEVRGEGRRAEHESRGKLEPGVAGERAQTADEL